jgi:hypothetical protein
MAQCPRADDSAVEDIVAVEVRLADGQRRHFLTWGRIQDPVDPEPLAEVVLRNAPRFSLGGEPLSARVLRDLRPAASAPYFLESFFQMCQQTIPYGPDYETWRERVAAEQEEGESLWYLGHVNSEQTDEPGAKLT